jgi:ribosomal protein L39E
MCWCWGSNNGILQWHFRVVFVLGATFKVFTVLILRILVFLNWRCSMSGSKTSELTQYVRIQDVRTDAVCQDPRHQNWRRCMSGSKTSELTALYVRIQDVRTDGAVCQDPRLQNWRRCMSGSKMSELTVLYVRIQDVRTDGAVCQDPRRQNWWCCPPENVNLYHHCFKKVTSYTALRLSYSSLTLWECIKHILPAIDQTAYVDA